MTKVIFIHGLPGCEFQVIEEHPGNPNFTNANKEEIRTRSALTRDTIEHMKCQIKIKISEGHKRVFFIKEPLQAYDLMKHLLFASKFWETFRPDNLDDPASRYELDASDPLTGGLLGEGSYGKVYKAIDKITKRFVAIKEINRERLGSEERRLMT